MLGGDFGEIAATANVAFLLAFPSLFSIINPIGGALIFNVYTRAFSRPDRIKTAGLVGLYSLIPGTSGVRCRRQSRRRACVQI